MQSTPSKRQQIVVLLLCVAVIAALVRQRAIPGSAVHDVSTVMMLLWLPVLGSILGWLIARLPRRRGATAPTGFPADQAFQPQLQARLQLRRSAVPVANVPLAAGEHRAVLVVGEQGFQMRWQVPAGTVMERGAPYHLPLELLSPALALPLLAPQTAFRLLVGDSFIADGQVLEQLPAPA